MPVQEPDNASLTVRALNAVKDMKAKLASMEDARHEPIAIVGMSCRFPGAADPEAYWQLLCEARDLVGPIPSNRFDMSACYDPTPGTPGKSYVALGAFLDQADGFDADFFGISPREAAFMDPQQRLLLELSWEALEQAALSADELGGSRSGVYFGLMTNDYQRLGSRDLRHDDYQAYTASGIGISFPAGRVSYLLGLQGPSMVVATACSSSLVASHLACQALRNRECDLALCGGVNLILTEDTFVMLSMMQALSPDGRCKSFDASANGYGRGEGGGVLVLKRLSDAEKGGDRILALIRGSAVNHNGRSGGLTVPNGSAQEQLLREALAAARVEPDDIDYIEAHGSGTALGDPIEVNALAEVFASDRPQPLIVGCGKTNIGHLEAAAGMVGLIKTVLSLQHQQIPAHLHLNQPSPLIDWAHAKIEVPREGRSWQRGERKRLAGVSSFGLSGINAHLILEEAPTASQPEASLAGPQLFLLSAPDEAALTRQVVAMRDWLRHHQDQALDELCATSQLGRSRHEQRLAVVADSCEDLVQNLEGHLDRQQPRAVYPGRQRSADGRKLAFLFTGQGAQYINMGRQLYGDQAVYRKAIDRCDQILTPQLGRSLLTLLFPDAEDTSIHETRYAQPCLFAVGYALAELWRSLGVQPDYLMGHSIGEYVAAQQAGVFSLEDALMLVAERGRLMHGLAPGGRMYAVQCDAQTLLLEIAEQRDQLALAAVNGPHTSVLSGADEAVEAMVERLSQRGIKARRLQVSAAFHSPLMDPILSAFRQVAERVSFRVPQLALISNLSGDFIDSEVTRPQYWVDHLRGTVQYADCIALLHKQGCQVFLEMGPDPVLLNLAREILAHEQLNLLPSLRKGRADARVMLESLAQLFVQGTPIQMTPWHPPQQRRHAQLPTYAFHRQRHWALPSAKKPPTDSNFRPRNPLLVSHPAAAQRNLGQIDRPLWVAVAELVCDPELAQRVHALGRRYATVPGTVGQISGRTFLFINAQRSAYFYCNHRDHLLVAQIYTGAPEDHAGLVRDLSAFCTLRGLEPAILAFTAEDRERMQALGFSTTIMGIWQDIADLEQFSLHGNAMRRLRYLVNRYEALGDVAVEEFLPGRHGELEDQIHQVMGAWAEHKGRGTGALVAHISEALKLGWHGSENRIFIVRQGQQLDGVLFVAPFPARSSYLLDVEFYRADVSAGAMEYAIVKVIERLSAEGVRRFSLGLTLVTQLGPDACEDPEVRTFFEELYQQGHFNGDGNAQFKNKFRPQTEPTYFCRPRPCNNDHLSEFLMMLADATNQSYPAVAAATPIRHEAMGALHPLCQRRLTLATRERVFETLLDPAQLPWLNDHRLDGKCLFPATGYLEMVLAAAHRLSSGRALASLEIQTPLFLPDEQQRLLQILINQDDPQRWSFRVLSFQDDQWICHASGALVAATSIPGMLAVSDWERRCPDQQDPAAAYQLLRTQGLEYGPGFCGIRKLSCGEQVGLVTLEAPTGLSRNGYIAHPALLDAALHGCQLLLPPALRNRLYLPLALDRFSLWRELPQQIRVTLSLRSCHAEAVVADIQLWDAQGNALAAFEGLVLKSPAKAASSASLDNVLFEPRWREQPLTSTPKVKRHRLIFTDGAGFGEALGLLGEESDSTLVYPGPTLRALDARTFELNLVHADQIQKLLAQLPSELDIVYFWDLDRPASAEGDQQLASLKISCLNLTALAASLGGTPQRQKLWLVTRHGSRVSGQQVPTTNSGGIFGFARVLSNELSDHWGGLIDLEDQDPLDAAELIQAELETGGSDLAAWRGRTRFVQRLQTLAADAKPLTFASVGTYLITGGLGGLGRSCAQWLADQGVSHLVLVSRSMPNAEQHDWMEQLRLQGKQVRHACLDICDLAALKALIDTIQASAAPLVGVLHTAGTVRDRPLIAHDSESYDAVLRPKILGAWHLHQLCQHLALRHFVLFSSISSLLGNPGQANYATANDFMDLLAQNRQAQGLVACSIHWGPWSEVGMADALGEEARARRHSLGVLDLSPEHGLAALARCMSADAAQVFACPLNLDLLAKSPLADQPLLAELLGQPRQSQQPPWAPAGRIANQPQACLGYLVTQLARIMNCLPERIPVDKALNSLGVDSLMIIELRNQIRLDLKAEIPAAVFFDFPTLTTLAQWVADRCPTSDEDQNKSLASADPAARELMVQAFVRECLAQVLQRKPEALNMDTPINRLGLDSLMVLELRNHIKNELGLNLAAAVFFDFPSGQDLVRILLGAFAAGTAESQPQSKTNALHPSNEMPVQVDDLSDDEVNRMLSELMSQDSAS